MTILLFGQTPLRHILNKLTTFQLKTESSGWKTSNSYNMLTGSSSENTIKAGNTLGMRETILEILLNHIISLLVTLHRYTGFLIYILQGSMLVAARPVQQQHLLQ
jgi:hypothetical protein